MQYFAVFAMRRLDLSEYIVSLAQQEEQAQNEARNIMAGSRETFVRCRVRPVDMKVAETKAVCYEWGRLDALAGEPLVESRLPRIYALAYRRGYRAGAAEAQRIAGEVENKPGGSRP